MNTLRSRRCRIDHRAGSWLQSPRSFVSGRQPMACWPIQPGKVCPSPWLHEGSGCLSPLQHPSAQLSLLVPALTLSTEGLGIYSKGKYRWLELGQGAWVASSNPWWQKWHPPLLQVIGAVSACVHRQHLTHWGALRRYTLSRGIGPSISFLSPHLVCAFWVTGPEQNCISWLQMKRSEGGERFPYLKGKSEPLLFQQQ